MNPFPGPAPSAQRRGFTMIELLVVMLIIAILVALLLPVIVGAVKKANAARCAADINTMVAALTQFKSTYGDFPPSRILIWESGFYDPTIATALSGDYGDTRTDTTVGVLNQRSLRYLQKFFPRAIVFSSVNGVSYDINSNGQIDTLPFMLTGDECLVFFLGGIGNYTHGSSGELVIGMSGFARDPSNPFNHASTSRTSPLFQFPGGRMVDPDNDGFPSYLDVYGSSDPGSRTYAYFASYGGGNYDPNDCDTLANGDFFTGWVDPHAHDDAFARAFQVQFPVVSSGLNSCFSPASVAISPGPNPYTASAPVGSGPAARVVWQNPETFQIVSAGSDQLFGIGGSFSTAVNNGGLAYTDAGGICGGVASAPNRSVENDNVTNFFNSTLQ